MIPMHEMSRDLLAQQKIEGNGRQWRKRVRDTAQMFGENIQNLIHAAADIFYGDLAKKARRQKAEQAWQAFNQRPRGRSKEPMVADFIRAFVSALTRHFGKRKRPDLAAAPA